MNAEWHKAHRMPASPTLEQRMAWHAKHIKHCNCREIPPKLAPEMKKRGLLPGRRSRSKTSPKHEA